MHPKTDLFTAIHKAIRALLYETGAYLQSVDFSNEKEVETTLERLECMLGLLQEHAENEDNLIFPAVERVAPGITAIAEAQHQDYELEQRQLMHFMEQLRRASDPFERSQIGIRLNRAYAGFLAFSLIHLNTEEETVLPASLRGLSDEELLSIRSRIQAGIPPAIYVEWMRYMLPSLNRQELMALFSSLQANAPAQVFERIATIGAEYIPSSRWEPLKKALAILQPPATGRV